MPPAVNALFPTLTLPRLSNTLAAGMNFPLSNMTCGCAVQPSAGRRSLLGLRELQVTPPSWCRWVPAGPLAPLDLSLPYGPPNRCCLHHSSICPTPQAFSCTPYLLMRVTLYLGSDSDQVRSQGAYECASGGVTSHDHPLSTIWISCHVHCIPFTPPFTPPSIPHCIPLTRGQSSSSSTQLPMSCRASVPLATSQQGAILGIPLPA